MPRKKALVVYYSRSGHTERAARRVADRIGADLARIEPRRRLSGPFGALRACGMVLRGENAKLEPIVVDPGAYDIVVLGTPIWFGHLSAPIRSWLAEHKHLLRDYACFFTYRGIGWPEAGEDMARLTGRSPAAVLDLRRADEGKASYDVKIRAFAREMGA